MSISISAVTNTIHIFLLVLLVLLLLLQHQNCYHTTHSQCCYAVIISDRNDCSIRNLFPEFSTVSHGFHNQSSALTLEICVWQKTWKAKSPLISIFVKLEKNKRQTKMCTNKQLQKETKPKLVNALSVHWLQKLHVTWISFHNIIFVHVISLICITYSKKAIKMPQSI